MSNILIKCTLFTILLLSVIILITGENEIVKTTHGLVSGKKLKTLIQDIEYYGFLGIPFAAPPVKELRFSPPQTIEPWEGVLSATEEKPPCFQFNTNIKKGHPIGDYGEEDCLYLDIHTPAPDNKQRSTIVFLYNEHFKSSYNKTVDYAPDFFIEEDVIIVTISHRLCVLGFLTVEEDILPGNAGLKDIVLALEWVKSNIERFGGDPNRITLLGSQGGAVAVDLLMRSRAKDLFNSAILQSGSSLLPIYLQENIRERAFKLAEVLELNSPSSSHVIQDLRDVPATKLLEKEMSAAPDDYNKDFQRALLTFGPIVEKTPDGLVTEYPENSSQKVNIPVMIGFNSREGLEPTVQYLLEPLFIGAIEKDFPFILPLRLKYRFNPLDDSYYDAVKDIKKYYFQGKTVTMDDIPEYVTFIGDVLMAYPMDATVRLLANVSESPVYYYHFDYYSDLNENKNNIMKHSQVEDGTWGAATADDLCYLFKCPELSKRYKKHYKTKSEEMKIQQAMVKLWSNFAKYGNPTPEDNPLDVQWSPYSVDTKEYLHIGKQIVMKRDLYKYRLRFWEGFIKKWEALAKDGVVTANKRDEL